MYLLWLAALPTIIARVFRPLQESDEEFLYDTSYVSGLSATSLIFSNFTVKQLTDRR